LRDFNEKSSWRWSNSSSRTHIARSFIIRSSSIDWLKSSSKISLEEIENQYH
jgi:hypothetical protein